MRRVFALILSLFFLALPVHAANAAQSISTTAYVTENGACRVTIDVDIRLDEPVRNLRFPIGKGIHSATVNGARADLGQSEGITYVNLDHLSGKTGFYTCSISYEVNTILSLNDQGKQVATVPLLYGFPFPVETMKFSINMPSDLDAAPVFYSGYHGQDIERQMTTSFSGAQVQGTVNLPLKDSETIFMTLVAPEGMFPPVQTFGGSMTFDAVAMGVTAAVAFLFWLSTMRTLPRFPRRRAVAPEGICAGQVPAFLVRRSAQLPIMVLQWAQLGYLSIHATRSGRVYLQQKMDMGNERSSFEQRCFRDLFAAKRLVEATGRKFHSICDKVAAYSLRQSNGYRSAPGAAHIFRLISAAVGLFAGIAMADAISTHHTWRIVLMALFGAAGYGLCWLIQGGMDGLHLRGKAHLKLTVLLSIAGLGASLACGCLLYGLGAVAWSLIAGYMTAYGGMRSDNGQRIKQEILSLRRHMRTADPEYLKRILASNRNYYYELAPYALVLDVDKTFAARFGDARLPECTWLDTGSDIRTPAAWNKELRRVYAAMTKDHPTTPAEQIFGV